jgi:hypothetical protein
MCEEFAVVEIGDAGDETRQSSPGGPAWDAIFGKAWA